MSKPAMRFVRENRYLVIKRKDILKHLSKEEADTLSALAKKITDGRISEGKKILACVVVEDDWPEYETVWDLIETRVREDAL